MGLLVTGGCGLTGTAIIGSLLGSMERLGVTVLDNLRRRGAETNVSMLESWGVRVYHGDVRVWSDAEPLPDVDWIIDCAAEPSVLAGTTSAVQVRTTRRQVIEHNLLGTVNVLEHMVRSGAGMVLLSSSRVYSMRHLQQLDLEVKDEAFVPCATADSAPGMSAQGVMESFPTTAPISLYGATKLASEALAMEYAAESSLPVFVNRCGLLAGAGQFGRADQGIFSWWIRQWAVRSPLRYIGYGGHGHQVRDCLHPQDVARLVRAQILAPERAAAAPVVNVSGGRSSAWSLAQLSRWCADRLGSHAVKADRENRVNDVPWLVLDHDVASRTHGWRPKSASRRSLSKSSHGRRADGPRGRFRLLALFSGCDDPMHCFRAKLTDCKPSIQAAE
jgi:CDP-paratose 2-epimerase